MSFAFERSLRSVSTGASAAPKQAPSLEARKKKTVSWGDSDSGSTAALAGTTKENSVDYRGDAETKGTTSTNSGLAGVGSIQEQSLDHLRVPSARSAAKVDMGQDLRGGTAANSIRKRGGEPSIPAGAVRVRTPAKPKRPRATGTPGVSSKLSPPSTSPEPRNNRASPRTSPRGHLRRGGGISGITASSRAVGASRTRQTSTPGRHTSVSPPRSPCTPKVSAKAKSPSSESPRRRCSPPSPRPVSSAVTLRSVAGGDVAGAECWVGDDTIEVPSLDTTDTSSLGRSPLSPGGLPRRSPRSPRTHGAGHLAPPSPSSSSFGSSFTSTDPVIEVDEEARRRRRSASKDEEEVRWGGSTALDVHAQPRRRTSS